MQMKAIYASEGDIYANEGDICKWSRYIDGWLVGFYVISTFVGYLTPNPFLYK